MEQLKFEDIKLIFEALLILILCASAYYWVWRKKEKKQEKKFDKHYKQITQQLRESIKTRNYGTTNKRRDLPFN